MRFTCLFLALATLTGFSAAQSANYQTEFSIGPRYLSLTGPDFLHPIATPSLNLDASLPPISSLPQIGPAVVNQEYIANPDLEHQADLFPIYYGYTPIPVIELTGSGSSEVPESLAGDGVTHIVSVQQIREMGYGVPIGEHAAYLKTRQRQGGHVYTNADIQRLRQN